MTALSSRLSYGEPISQGFGVHLLCDGEFGSTSSMLVLFFLSKKAISKANCATGEKDDESFKIRNIRV
jgi:hypothetical protein